jgi:hypothetical protein
VPSNDSELVNVRIAADDLDALRLVCQATGRSMASEIRQGVQLRLLELRKDADVQRAIKEHADRVQRFYSWEPTPEEGLDEAAADTAPKNSRSKAKR